MNTAEWPKTPKVNVFVPDQAPLGQIEALEHLADGIPGANKLKLSDGYVDCDVAVIIGIGKRQLPGPRQTAYDIVAEHHYSQDRPVVILNKGYIHPGEYFGVHIRGSKHLDYRLSDYGLPADRFDALDVPIKPYRDGEYTLICGQVPDDETVAGHDHIDWIRRCYAFLENESELPVRFRPHPKAYPGIEYGIPYERRTWEQDLAGAHTVLTHSSTASALALLDGIPIFTLDDGSIAWPVGIKRLQALLVQHPIHVSREQWAYDLGYAQWTLDELQSGQCWNFMWSNLR